MRFAAFVVALASTACLPAWADAVTSGATDHPSAGDIVSLKHIGGEYGTFTVSPDQKWVAYQMQSADIANRTYRLEWFAGPIDASQSPMALGGGGEPILETVHFGMKLGTRVDAKPEWSPDSRWIAYLRRDSGRTQVWRSRVVNGQQEQLTTNAADVLQFIWREDGNAIYFFVGRDVEGTRQKDVQEGNRGYLLDDRFIPYHSLKPLWSPCGGNEAGLPTPAGQECEPTLWVAEFGRSERRASRKEEETVAGMLAERRPAGVSLARKIQNIAWRTPAGPVAWFENEYPSTKPGFGAPLTLFASGVRCALPECHGSLEQVTWIGGEVLFLREEGHAGSIPALYAWQPSQNRIRLIHRVDGRMTACETAGRFAVCLYEMPTSPRKIVKIDLFSGEISDVFDPNPGFANFRLGRVERLDWKDAFGNSCFAHLVYPPDYDSRKRYPLIVVQYRSRGFLNGGVGDEYPILPLAARGFLVLSFDRPEDEDILSTYVASSLEAQGQSEAQLWKDGYTRRQALSALEIILDRLDRGGLIDPLKVGITGLSDGAETTEFALFNSHRFAAAAHSGNWSPEAYALTINGSMRRFYRDMLMATSGPSAIDKWKALSLAHHADSVSAPLLVQVSDRELLLALPSIVALKDAHRPVDAYVFPDEYHIKWQPQHKLAVAERTVDWFEFWLQDREDPDPSKAEQYKRWRQLREAQQMLSTANGTQE